MLGLILLHVLFYGLHAEIFSSSHYFGTLSAGEMSFMRWELVFFLKFLLHFHKKSTVECNSYHKKFISTEKRQEGVPKLREPKNDEKLSRHSLLLIMLQVHAEIFRGSHKFGTLSAEEMNFM